MVQPMSNTQLTEMIERAMGQLAELATAHDITEGRSVSTAQALEELTAATHLMSAEMDRRIQACEGSLEALKAELEQAQKSERERTFRLLDAKSMRPNRFGGNRKAWRTWSRTMKAFLNSQYPGARDALEYMEKLDHKPTEDDVDQLQWKNGKALNEGLYDILLTHTESEPQGMVCNCKPKEGFAIWKKLSNFYEPRGGESDVDRLNKLLQWPRAKNMENVSNTVESWEAALAEYVDRTGEDFPERFKVNLLLRMLPTEAESEVRLRHVTGKMISYEALRETIEAWIVQVSHRNIAQHLDAFSAEEERRAGLADQRNEDESVDALKATGRDAKPKPKAKPKAKSAKFDGNCAYCDKYGHKAIECRARIRDEAAGVEKAKMPSRRAGKKGNGRGANALEEGEERELEVDDSMEAGLGSLHDAETDSEDGDFDLQALSEPEEEEEEEEEDPEGAEIQEFEAQRNKFMIKAEQDHREIMVKMHQSGTETRYIDPRRRQKGQ